MFQKEKFWGAKYVVAMDPLDGSSNIACNVPVIQQSPIWMLTFWVLFLIHLLLSLWGGYNFWYLEKEISFDTKGYCSGGPSATWSWYGTLPTHHSLTFSQLLSHSLMISIPNVHKKKKLLSITGRLFLIRSVQVMWCTAQVVCSSSLLLTNLAFLVFYIKHDLFETRLCDNSQLIRWSELLNRIHIRPLNWRVHFNSS